MNSNVVIAILVCVGVVGRFFIEVPNVSPMITIALLGGYFVGARKAWIIPILAMLITDSVIGFYDWKLMFSVYACFILPVFLSRFINKDLLLSPMILSALGSTCFFVITNFTVWATSQWYPHTITGLLECYIAAIPFYRNMLVGDVILTFSCFGLCRLVMFSLYPSKTSNLGRAF
jgi:hypothetical protein